MFIPALLLAGCSNVNRSAAGGATASPNCVYSSKAYRHGSLTCQDRTRYRCEDGVWNSTFKPC